MDRQPSAGYFEVRRTSALMERPRKAAIRTQTGSVTDEEKAERLSVWNQDWGGALNRCFDFGSPNAYLAKLGPDNSMAYTQLQLQRWTGSSWELSGGVLSADQK